MSDSKGIETSSVAGLDEIRSRLRLALPGLESEYGVASLAVFGSFVKEQQREDSDVDLLVEFLPDARVTLFRLVDLEIALGDVLGRKVDLVMEGTLKPEIGKRVMREAVPV